MAGVRATERGLSPDLHRPAKQGCEGGFTLIELLVVVGVFALVAGLAAPALGTLTGANARSAAGSLAGAMRYMFDTAALRRERCRIALDAASRAWWAECAPGGAAAVAKDARTQERAQELADDLARRFPDEKDAAMRKLLGQSAFGSFSDAYVQKRELPGRAGFGKISVEGLADAEGQVAYVYFFPGGRALRAYVPIVDGANVFTVVVEPFNGHARVVPGAVEPKK
jgi:general secretion pathway protein H